MTPAFADTSFFVALASPVDHLHDRAIDLLKHSRDGLVTTEYVLVEVGNWCSKVNRRRSFVLLVEALSSEPQITFVDASRELFRRGYELFRRRSDKDWSLTDCISFIVMQQQGITEALTTDHHFEQAGFVALLK